MLNAEAPWDAFDPHAYIDHNYRYLLDADAEIVQLVGRHFSDHFRGNSHRPVLGIDVGAGANLYPALTMLPWCSEITLLERSPKNVEYLKEQKPNFHPEWDRFWKLLCEQPEYDGIDAVRRERFSGAVRVREGDLFDLGRRGLFGSRPYRRWQMGTMFFVAESLSSSHEEFRRAVECFMRALAPGAPFAAAFMEGSKGYSVGDRFFPACDVNELQVDEILEPFAGAVDYSTLGEVRPGHTGIILALGHRKSNSVASVLSGGFSKWLNPVFRHRH
ncbi:SCO2525 family SAM-dependent methyltransferase [Streptomyces sp. NL15-2K]|uniref:SCO2525 family SAM-dependent methyltransferase n=1 Tax=Streptomyces sp. NL15-2K TaxID=376149 RepID=UPI000F584F82|nr:MULTISPECIES: SCO2525 family SAM-dependent methyltransferase [Actinomycetes]WKX08556.1 SCO2525 family SAM-dependent methyltransferase [Kutzneria buriramensis]